jgi:hypothetical protein
MVHPLGFGLRHARSHLVKHPLPTRTVITPKG